MSNANPLDPARVDPLLARESIRMTDNNGVAIVCGYADRVYITIERDAYPSSHLVRTEVVLPRLEAQWLHNALGKALAAQPPENGQ